MRYFVLALLVVSANATADFKPPVINLWEICDWDAECVEKQRERLQDLQERLGESIENTQRIVDEARKPHSKPLVKRRVQKYPEPKSGTDLYREYMRRDPDWDDSGR